MRTSEQHKLDMNTKLAVGILAAIVIIGGGITWASQSSQAPQITTPETELDKQDSTMAANQGNMMDKEKDKMVMDDTMILGVVMKSGKLFSVWPHDEIAELTHDLFLKNGTKVTKAGVITSADGKTITLKEGQRLANTGEITSIDTSKLRMMEVEGMMGNDKMMDGKDGNTVKKDEGMMAKHGEYLDYSPETLKAEIAEDHKVVLFFHAPWCPFCKAADAAFKAKLDQIPANVVILKTDYDSNTALKQQYGVTYQHTFVQIDKDGNMLSKWNGGDLANLVKYLK